MIPVVILAAGGGKRLGPVGEKHRKVLLPVGDRSLLAHHLGIFSAIGARRFILVVDPQAEEVAAEARRCLGAGGGSCEVVEQARRLGIGHAALLAEPWVRGGPFVLVLGDTYYEPRDLAGAAREIAAGEADALLSVRRVEDEALIRKECSIELDARGLVRRIVEKPPRALSDLKPCGVYFFGPRLLEALRGTPPSALRGEVELTDAVQRLIAQGGRVGVRETLKRDVNITFPEDILAANLAWLEERGRGRYVDPQAVLGEGARVERSVVSRGARVGAGAGLERCVVFPGGEVPAGARLSDALCVPGLGEVGCASGRPGGRP